MRHARGEQAHTGRALPTDLQEAVDLAVQLAAELATATVHGVGAAS